METSLFWTASSVQTDEYLQGTLDVFKVLNVISVVIYLAVGRQRPYGVTGP